jgi:hypothetical protein
MTLRSYLWGMRIGVAAAFAAWILVLRQIDPDKSGFLGQALFYASTFLLFAGLLILFFTWMRRKIGGSDESALVCIGISFRQGILMSLLLVGLLVLQQYRILVWWDGALLVAGIFLVELYFLTRR